MALPQAACEAVYAEAPGVPVECVQPHPDLAHPRHVFGEEDGIHQLANRRTGDVGSGYVANLTIAM